MDWKPIKSCPWQTVVQVRNPQMQKPVLATRGFADEHGVHPDNEFFTSVFTPHQFDPFPSGKLVIPTQWKEQ